MTLWRPGLPLWSPPYSSGGMLFYVSALLGLLFYVSALLGLFIWSPGTGRVAPVLALYAGPGTGRVAPVLALAAATWLVRCHIDPTCIILTF